MTKRIAIVGDYDPEEVTHQATDRAIADASHALELRVEGEWISTKRLKSEAAPVMLADYAGILIAPGSPYQSMEGALNAIRYAREADRPLLGTCGGFQHVVIEFARNVLGIREAQHAEYDPYASVLLISRLDCSLVGKQMKILINQESCVRAYYGAAESHEKYYCNFGLNPEYQTVLESSGLSIAAVDDQGKARILAIPDNRFFVATLFVPQLSSEPAKLHPLIRAFLQTAAKE